MGLEAKKLRELELVDNRRFLALRELQQVLTSATLKVGPLPLLWGELRSPNPRAEAATRVIVFGDEA